MNAHISIKTAQNGFVVNFNEYSSGTQLAIALTGHEMLEHVTRMLCRHYSIFPVPEITTTQPNGNPNNDNRTPVDSDVQPDISERAPEIPPDEITASGHNKENNVQTTRALASGSGL